MKIIYGEKTLYNDIAIGEEEGIRYLLFQGGLSKYQSAIKLSNLNAHVFEYTRIMMEVFDYVDNIENVLVIGLGGGIIPRSIRKLNKNTEIDIIEIDPEIPNIAKDLFGCIPDNKMYLHIGDAGSIIKSMDKKYDIIMLDAFNSGYVPYHLMCVSFFEDIKRLCKDKFIIVSNLHGDHYSVKHYIKGLFDIFGDNIYRQNSLEQIGSTIMCVCCGLRLGIHFRKEKLSDEIKNTKHFEMPKGVMYNI